MNFYDFKTAIEGYMNYLQLISGLEVEMNKNKKWRVFEYKTKSVYSDRWETIVEFDYSELNNYLIIRIYQWNYPMKLSGISEVNQKKYKMRSYDGGDRGSLEATIKNIEDIVAFMNVIEETKYFERLKRL